MTDEAVITPGQFIELHNKFKNTKVEGNPVIVRYYLINDAICYFMNFGDVRWKTTINSADKNSFVTQLNLHNSIMPVRVSELPY